MLFATEGELPDENGTLPTGVVTTPVRMSAKEIIVIAPAMSLDEGDIRTGRGEPCWNPPCRRTVISVAINGIDFVEGAVPIEYYFFYDPTRYLNLLLLEFGIYQSALQVSLALPLTVTLTLTRTLTRCRGGRGITPCRPSTNEAVSSSP